jgi:beta-galactosidase
LFLNERSLGKKSMPRNGHLTWMVNYEPGTISAVGKRNGRNSMEARWTTMGEAEYTMASLFKNRLNADGRDATVVNVSVGDKDWNPVPDASHLIKFSISGPAKIIGVGNGDPSSHEPDKYFDNNWQRHLFNGKCQVIIQPTKEVGEAVLTITGEGLKPTSVKLFVNKPE